MNQPQEEPHKEPKASKEANESSVVSNLAPSNVGNAAGEHIQNALGGIGGPLGQSLETATKPVGNVVDSVVGGVFRAGDMATSETGLGKEADLEKKRADGAVEKSAGE